MGGVSLLTAFLAGVVSFLSPCVLPLVPGYLSVVTGVSLADLRAGQRRSSAVLYPSLLFVIGFAVVFMVLGASASMIGAFLAPNRELLTRIAGVLVIAMGVLMLGLFRVPWLYGEARFDIAGARRLGRGASLLMGMAFGFGWTPCVGPILASILALAGSSSSLGRGVLLLAIYSLGLAIPFVAVALLFGRVQPLLRWLSAHSSAINRIAGVLLIVVGVLIVTDTLRVVSAWMLRVAPFLSFG